MLRPNPILPIVTVLAAGVVSGSAASRAQEGATGTAAALAGRWMFNPELSDDAREKMREAMEARGGGRLGPGGPGPVGGGGGGRGGFGGGQRPGMRGPGEDRRETMRYVVEAPPELAITPTETEIVVLEKDGRMRTLHPDGKTYRAEGGSAEVKTRWDAGRLVVETKSARGPRLTETFEVAADRSRMTVILRLEGSPLPEVTVKRAYEPAEAATQASPPR
jgi:hypothetical protein